MPRKILQGTIESVRDKTILVKVESFYKHPLYGKTIRRSSKYSAHVPREGSLCKQGDKVEIRECAPVSKRKSWELIGK